MRRVTERKIQATLSPPLHRPAAPPATSSGDDSFLAIHDAITISRDGLYLSRSAQGKIMIFQTPPMSFEEAAALKKINADSLFAITD
jgi:hypothetical protein